MRAYFYALLSAMALVALSTQQAAAVPAYAVQTGQPCTACHVGGFGPQLTPFGRQFKLEGYTMRAGDEFTAPISAMAVFSYVHTNKDQPPPAAHYAVNDNTTLDQASLFLAGGVGDHFGGFFQMTYDGIGRAFSWDNLDLRATTHETIGDNDVLLGVTLTNNPTVQDGWNSTSAWGYPYTGSDLVPGPAAATQIDGGLAQTTLGTSIYAYWNSSLYTEVGVYWTPGRQFLNAMGAFASDNNIINGAAPYVRVAYQKDYGDQNFEIGAFGLFPHLYPGGDKSAGTTDRYSDIGVDASYQFMGDSENIYQVDARYTSESQNLAATQFLGGSVKTHNHLNDLRVDATYNWHNMIGVSAGAFDTWGSSDALLYADNRTFKPDSAGFVLQTDYTLFGGADTPLGGRFNARIGLQYFIYTKFNGATSNYDGFGANASDNNAFRLFLWTAL
ncbi:MAG: cytochrome C [Proteobacteria bacterium]|nr:cytochrome C [Pseudomonadota bacterium]